MGSFGNIKFNFISSRTIRTLAQACHGLQMQFLHLLLLSLHTFRLDKLDPIHIINFKLLLLPFRKEM